MKRYKSFRKFKKHGLAFITASISPFVLAAIFISDMPYLLKGWSELDQVKLLIVSVSLLSCVVGVLGSVIVMMLSLNKKKNERILNMRFHLHEMTHCSRDAVTESILRRDNKNDLDELNKLQLTTNALCNAVEKYLMTQVGDPTIGCAVRVGLKYDDDVVNSEYIAIGRSSNLEHGRSKTSQPLMRDEGILKCFEESKKGITGALFYYDLPLAAKHGLYKITKNDENYSEDVRSMIVTPINGLEKDGEDCIGLLHITSKSDKIMDASLVNVVKFFADHFAQTFTSLFDNFESKDRALIAINIRCK